MDIHGEWRLKIIRDVVYTELKGGAWNREAMQAYSTEYKIMTQHLRHYCNLARYVGWNGYTDEATTVAHDIRRWAFDHGCVCAAWVFDEPLMKKWMDLMLRTPDGLHEVGTFATMNDAILWLGQKGFEIDLPEIMA